MLKGLLFLFLSLVLFTACKSSSSSDSIDPAPKGAEETNKELFFDYGSQWKYLDNGSAQPATWTHGDFDDSGWKTGKGIFSHGFSHEGKVTTTLADLKAMDFGDVKPTAYYFRKSVKVTNIKTLKDVYLKMVVDDAAVIYVNGKEIARSPLLKRDEEITHTTLPLRYSKYAAEAEHTFVLPADAFVEGSNAIAVMVFNDINYKINDVLFNATLTPDYEYKGDPDGPYVFRTEDQVITKSFTKDGLRTRKYNTTDDIKIVVELPAALGNFEVQLRENHTPPAYRYEKPSKFFVTSDLEGNIEALVYMLVQAGVMDKDYNWTYGTGHLCHLGDLFDRGAFVTESLWLLYHLENQARLAGGDVHVIMGNHDMMNLYGDFRYVHPRYFENASYLGKTFLELYGEDTELGRWIRSKNFMEIAGDILFVHAGFNTDVISELENGTLTLDKVNEIGRQHTKAGYMRFDEQGDLIKDTFYQPSRLYWDRSIPSGKMSQEDLVRGLKAFGSEMMIIGHTVFEKPTPLYEQKVIAADVDHNQNFQEEGRIQALEYHNGKYYHFIADKKAGVTRSVLF